MTEAGAVAGVGAAADGGTDEARLLGETARGLFAGHCTPEAVDAAIDAGWDAALWDVLQGLELTTVSVPEAAGGSGGGLREVSALLRAAGEYAAPVPLAETALLGGWLLATAGLPLPAGPLAAALIDGPDDAAVSVTPPAPGAAVTVRGRMRRVPWARCARQVVLLVRSVPAAAAGAVRAEEYVIVLDPASCVLEPGTNVAGEPRDDLLIDLTVAAERIAPVPEGTVVRFTRRAALARVLLMAGAAGKALDQTLTYTTQREQFGRPISRFQAVQHLTAELAGEAAALRAAADAAIVACADHGFASPEAATAVAAAKTTAGRAASVIATIAHQLHGAIGFTREHPLRLATTRLWAWRDEAGNEAAWADTLGAAALSAGASGLWGLITAGS